MLKNRLLISIIAVLLIFASAVSLSGCSLIYFAYQSKWGYCIDDFHNYQADFEAVANFCQDYLKNIGAFENGERWLIYYEPRFSGVQKGQLYAIKASYLSDWQMIVTPVEIGLCVERLSSAFRHKDANFDHIECFGGKVYFETHNGLYSVVYSPNERPAHVDFVHKGMAKRITGDWYHVVPEWE